MKVNLKNQIVKKKKQLDLQCMAGVTCGSL